MHSPDLHRRSLLISSFSFDSQGDSLAGREDCGRGEIAFAVGAMAAGHQVSGVPRSRFGRWHGSPDFPLAGHVP